MSISAVRRLDCLDCQHKKQSDWDVLSEEELVILNEGTVLVDYSPKEVIFDDGEPCKAIYCVKNGLVGVRKVHPEGDSVLVRLIFPGDTLGYRPLLAEEPHQGIGEALKNTTLCRIETSTVQRLIKNNPALGLRFLKRAARAMGEAEEKYFENITLDIRTRLCHLIAVLVSRYGIHGDDDKIYIEMPISRRDLAALIGSRPESLSRVIKSMEEEGIISFSGRKVCITKKNFFVNELRLDQYQGKFA